MTTPARPGVFVTTSLNPLETSQSGIPGEALPCFALPYNRGPIAPTLIKSWQQFVLLYGGFNVSGGSLLHYAVYQYFNNNGSACYVLRLPNSDAVYATTSFEGINSDVSTAILTVKASSPGAWGNQLYLTVNTTGVAGRVNITVYNGGSLAANVVETWVDLSMNPADPRNVAAIINSPISGSAYITVTESLGSGYVAGTTDLAVVASPQALTTGADGTTVPTIGTAIPAALDQLQNQILNLNVPGWTTTSDLNTLISWAQGRGDVFLVIDGPVPSLPETSAQVAQNYINMVQTNGINQTVQAAVYAPWLQIANPASAVPGATAWVPPGGAVLGVWNYTDQVYGVQKTPAGIQTPIKAIGLEAKFTASDLNGLKSAMINPIKQVPGAGFCIFDGMTLLPGYPNQFISVERTIQMLVHDLTDMSRFALFEPNDANLWAQITSVVERYLTQLMQQGVLAGSTPDTSFAVVCDSSNNTLNSAQSGMVNVSVAVALTSPAEFILINLSQFQGTTTATVTTS
jgi:hypothetical protein